jgi:1-acyl-sn-glycerol-3-phosphate acyltransferase
MPHLLAAWNLLLIAVWTGLLIPVQAAALLFGGRAAEVVPMRYHRGLARIIGLRVTVRGEISRVRPTLFVVNHSSWLDITVIDSLLPVCFVAKREVAGWPVFGLLAKLQRTVFVERAVSRTASQRDMMAERLAAADNLVLFAEGTSGDGSGVLPFKTSFFALAERPVNGRPLTVQPLSITYVAINGLPLGRHLRPVLTWFADMSMAPHAWGVLGIGPISVAVQFHDPVTIEAFGSRKALAAHCRARIAQSVSDAIAGRQSTTAQDPRPAPMSSASP